MISSDKTAWDECGGVNGVGGVVRPSSQLLQTPCLGMPVLQPPPSHHPRSHLANIATSGAASPSRRRSGSCRGLQRWRRRLGSWRRPWQRQRRLQIRLSCVSRGITQVRFLARDTAWQPVRSRVTHHRHMHTNMHAHEQGRGVVWPGTPREVKLAHREVPIAVVDGAVQLSGPDCTIWATG